MSRRKYLVKLPELDHRAIGLRQKLFFFDRMSKGSCFFLPRGARIFNKLIEFMRSEYRVRGYEEVITPTIYDSRLWERSGHWSHYKENMIKLELAERQYTLKPMNCPAHCLVYMNHIRSSSNNKLPIRLADFGTLHRNELSGSLMGLARVRQFHQDDAHIFCTTDQIEAEVSECVQFARDVYAKFNFNFDIRLSLRPNEFLGEPLLWDQAENALRAALTRLNLPFQEASSEGAFYGPKIDLIVKDSLARQHQCSTIQLDFQLPQRFKLMTKHTSRQLEQDADDSHSSDDCDTDTSAYHEDDTSDDELNFTSSNAPHRPVIIHRAILGSLERFIAMLAENWRGRWPFWLSPLQAQVIPVHERFNDYAQSVTDELRKANFWVDCNLKRNSSLNLKIRQASLLPYNLILVVGERDASSDSVTCRSPTHSVKDSSISLTRLIKLMGQFEREQIDRADIELLRHIHT